MLAFVPPKEDAKNLPRYASYVVGSGMKLHSRIVDAKNSWRNRGWHHVDTGELVERYGQMRPERKYVTKQAFILENIKGQWFVLYNIEAGLTEDELPWKKEFLVGGYYNNTLMTDYIRGNSYYQQKIADGTYKVVKKNAPMTTDEYVAWRIQVELELRGIEA